MQIYALLYKDLSIHGFWYGAGWGGGGRPGTSYEIKNLRFLWFGGFFFFW